VILKQLMVGGPLEALRRAEAAVAHHLGVCFTTSLESRVGRLGVAHVAASFRSSLQVAGGLNTGHLFRRDLGADLEIEGGVISLGSEPGLGPVQLEVAS